jgi:hypothetical protein
MVLHTIVTQHRYLILGGKIVGTPIEQCRLVSHYYIFFHLRADELYFLSIAMQGTGNGYTFRKQLWAGQDLFNA